MKKLTIAGIGELLWDILPEGEKLGGAPINFVYHVTSLGASGIAVSTVGMDPRGNQAMMILEDKGVITEGISRTSHFPTGFVKAHLDPQGIASYSFPDDVAWDHLQINSYARQATTELDGICFGTLAQRSQESRQVIHQFLGSCSKKTLKVYDINLRQNFYSKEIITTSLGLCNVLKINEEELVTLSSMFALYGSDREKAAALLRHHQLELVILTRGSNGSLLLNRSGFSEHHGTKAEIVDTIGAGDSFTATATIGYLLGKDLDIINKTAANVAAYLCSKPGAMVEIPDRLKY